MGTDRSRVAFTSDDDENLVQWLARRMPYKGDGGRQGNKEWEDLCERAEVSLSSPFVPTKTLVLCLSAHSLLDEH